MATTKIDTATGHAILVCACGSETDKGCPPIEGQDDSGFKCEACQHVVNKAAAEKEADTTVLSGS